MLRENAASGQSLLETRTHTGIHKHTHSHEYTHTPTNTHMHMNTHIDSHEDTHRARTSINLLDLVKSWGVWKAGEYTTGKSREAGMGSREVPNDASAKISCYSKGGFLPGAEARLQTAADPPLPDLGLAHKTP